MTPEHRLIKIPGWDENAFSVLMDIAKKLDTLMEDHQATRDMIENHMNVEEYLRGWSDG